MTDFTTASGRQTIDVAETSEIARMARGSDPNIVSTDDMQSLLGNSALVLDGQRRRPNYFDGRFLTGADLTRDQDYIRQRQADLARATGTGVVNGLQVSLGGTPGGQTLIIQPGHGVTPAGDLVMVTTARSVPILDLPSSRQLDATFGLSLEPRLPLGRRTGLFLLALRPVEFTANPIAAYPTTINGPRQVQNGDIIEATSIDLIPYPDTAGAGSLDEARRAVARQLFLGQANGLPQNALPLAVVALDKGAVRWIDMALVRRETGADTPLQVSLGARPRALAEAFVLQHRNHLADVLSDRAQAGLAPAFAAAQYFSALPAAGQLPAAAILPDSLGFRQMWFPSAVDVDVSFVPSDEIATLIEESLTLPPIDLLGDPADLDATGVIVLAPVTRTILQQFEAALSALETGTRPDPGQGIRRAPTQLLAQLSARRALAAPTPVADPVAAASAQMAQQDVQQWQTAWAQAVSAIPLDASGTPLLWYIRRRAVAYESQMVGVAVAASGDDEQLQRSVDQHLVSLSLDDEVKTITSQATPFATARIYAFLGGPRIVASTILTAAVVKDLTAALPPASPPIDSLGGTSAPVSPVGLRPPLPINPVATPILATSATAIRPGLTRLATSRIALTSSIALRPLGVQPLLSEGDVIAVASDYDDPNLGDGLDSLTSALAATPLPDAAQLWLGGTGQALDLDTAARGLSGDALKTFAASVADLAGKANDDAAKALATLIADAVPA